MKFIPQGWYLDWNKNTVFTILPFFPQVCTTLCLPFSVLPLYIKIDKIKWSAIKQRKQKNSLNKKNITGKKLLKSKKNFVRFCTKTKKSNLKIKKNINKKNKMNISALEKS